MREEKVFLVGLGLINACCFNLVKNVLLVGKWLTKACFCTLEGEVLIVWFGGDLGLLLTDG